MRVTVWPPGISLHWLGGYFGMGRRRRIHSRFLQSVALIVVASASVSVARAQTPNTTIANVNALNLLAPFLTLNATPIGQETLQKSLETVISINNNSAGCASKPRGQRCTKPDERRFKQDHEIRQY